MAPELLKEVSTHVEPFRKWQGTNTDGALEEYVLELADNLCLPSQGIRIDRAGAMLHCIVGFDRQSWCLIELLRHWRGMDIPVELESVIEEARSWPKPHFEELQEQLVLLDVQRILAKYGLLGSCTTYPSYNERLVHHLLSGVENQASLCDALAILKMFPQRFTRTEALFIRLSHIASLAEAGTSFEVLRHDSLLALSTAPITERMVAVWYFASNCSNLLGDWACAIDVCESQDRACRRKELSPLAAWKTCSSTLCTLCDGDLARCAA